MRVFDIFSKRREDEARAGCEDVYQYEDIPAPLRSQIKRITLEALGAEEYYDGVTFKQNGGYQTIESIYCREVGIDYLDPEKPFLGVIRALDAGQTERFLDILELICRMVDQVTREFSDYQKDRWNIQLGADDALAEINYRLRRSGFGYQFEAGNLIRQDSVFVHDEIIKPALSLLSRPGFAGVQEEFLTAHRHYRDGENEQAITEAAKSFESMMKAICEAKGWAYPKGARASDLVKILRSHGFLPDYLDNSFDQLAATLTSGLPKVRNDTGAHGQGGTPRKTPVYIAAYALNLAASKIVFLGNVFDSDG